MARLGFLLDGSRKPGENPRSLFPGLANSCFGLITRFHEAPGARNLSDLAGICHFCHFSGFPGFLGFSGFWVSRVSRVRALLGLTGPYWAILCHTSTHPYTTMYYPYTTHGTHPVYPPHGSHVIAGPVLRTPGTCQNVQESEVPWPIRRVPGH